MYPIQQGDIMVNEPKNGFKSGVQGVLWILLMLGLIIFLSWGMDVK